MLLIPTPSWPIFCNWYGKEEWQELKRDKEMILSVSSEMAFPEWHFAIVVWNKSADI